MVALLAAMAMVAAACASSSGPGWTYAPQPVTPVPSPAASAGASGASGGPGASGSAGASGGAGASGSPVGSNPNASNPASNPAASGANAGTTITLAAQNVAYDKQTLQAPANTPFTIAFNNQDAGVPHNVSIHKDSPTGQEVFHGDIITGPAQTSYNVPALAPGTYGFVCSVHSNMTGTLTVQ